MKSEVNDKGSVGPTEGEALVMKPDVKSGILQTLWRFEPSFRR